MTEPHFLRLLGDTDVVVGVVRTNGRCDARDFIQKLQPRYQARYQRFLEYLRDGIPIQSPEHVRRLSPSGEFPVVYELKADKYRLYVVRDSQRWYVTHGRDKPKDNRVGAEIDKALSIYSEGTNHE
jgi:hypothetical protein